MKTKYIAGLVVQALVATAVGVVLARDTLDRQPPEGNRSPMIAPQWSEEECEMDQLTEEERGD